MNFWTIMCCNFKLDYGCMNFLCVLISITYKLLNIIMCVLIFMDDYNFIHYFILLWKSGG